MKNVFFFFTFSNCVLQQKALEIETFTEAQLASVIEFADLLSAKQFSVELSLKLAQLRIFYLQLPYVALNFQFCHSSEFFFASQATESFFFFFNEDLFSSSNRDALESYFGAAE